MACDDLITHIRTSINRNIWAESSTDEEELIRLLGFAPLGRIVEFVCSKSNMDLHYPTPKLKTPLTAAIDRGDAKILETLLDEYPAVSLDSTTTQPCGRTALMYASYVTRDANVIRVLLENGADLQKVDMLSRLPGKGWNCLHYAIAGERRENVKFLLESGADPNSRDFDGRTPLITAVILSTQEIAECLLSHGVDTGATDSLGFSALRLAILGKKQELAVLLVGSGSVLTSTPSIFPHSDYELANYLAPDIRRRCVTNGIVDEKTSSLSPFRSTSTGNFLPIG